MSHAFLLQILFLFPNLQVFFSGKGKKLPFYLFFSTDYWDFSSKLEKDGPRIFWWEITNSNSTTPKVLRKSYSRSVMNFARLDPLLPGQFIGKAGKMWQWSTTNWRFQKWLNNTLGNNTIECKKLASQQLFRVEKT